MKLGYSILLGEYVESAFVDYNDCKHFQIVCPCCKEPTFKAVKEEAKGPIHYLSHYRKDEAYESECELRVSRISEEEIKKTNSQSRNQKIEYFLSVLQDAIITHEYPGDAKGQESARRFIRDLLRSKALCKLRELLFDFERGAGNEYMEENLDAYFNDYVRDITEVAGEFYKTTYALNVQKRIAADIWQHLLSAKAKDNYFFLFSHAYIVLLLRMNRARSERSLLECESDLHRAMSRIPEASKQEGLDILEWMREYPVGPPFAIEGSTLFAKFCSEITHEMLGTLLRLPYFDILKQQASKQQVSASCWTKR